MSAPSTVSVAPDGMTEQSPPFPPAVPLRLHTPGPIPPIDDDEDDEDEDRGGGSGGGNIDPDDDEEVDDEDDDDDADRQWARARSGRRGLLVL